jgi:hypothetical protein
VPRLSSAPQFDHTQQTHHRGTRSVLCEQSELASRRTLAATYASVPPVGAV